MEYTVLDIFPIGENTAVTVSGNGSGLQSNITVLDENGGSYRLLNLGMQSGSEGSAFHDTTELLIQGRFNSKRIYHER